MRFHNTTDMEEYFRAIRENRLPIAEQAALSLQDIQEEWLSLSLRLAEGISWMFAQEKLGTERAGNLWKKAEQLPPFLRNLTPDSLSLTPDGWFRENSILLWLMEGMFD